MEQSKEIQPVTIWDKYTKEIDVDGQKKTSTDIKSLVIDLQFQIHIHTEQIKKINEALGYLAHWMETEENKNKIEIIKPDIILPHG